MRWRPAFYGLHENRPMDRCLKTAVCVAAASLRHPTCTGGVDRLEACLAYGERLGFRTPI